MTDPFDRPPTNPAEGAPAAGGPTLPPAPPRSAPVDPSPPAPPAATGAVPPLPAAAKGRRSRAAMIGALVGVVAVLAAGVFAITQLSGDDEGSSGGAATPEAVADDFVKALNDEDVLGLIDLLLPGERETFRKPAVELVDQLKRIQVLDGSADLGKVSALDVQIDDVEVDVEETNVDDIAVVHVSGRSVVELHGDKVPIGDLLVDLGFGGERPEIDDARDREDLDATFTVVRKDGDWYLSLLYSAAQSAAAGQDVPESGIAARGADTPEGAIERLLEATSHLDLQGIIATLNPNEAEALQRYAPLFLDDGQAALDEVRMSIDINDVTTKVYGSGDTRQVAITSFDIDVSAEGEEVHVESDGKCLTIEGAGQSIDSCEGGEPAAVSDTIDRYLAQFADQLGIDPDELEPLADALTNVIETAQASLDDYEFHGIVVSKVGDEWYVSPIATYSEGLLSFFRALDRDEIENIATAIQDLVTEFSGLSSDVD
jgi:hypothetical protein